MKNKLDLDSLQILLHKYYEAETSPEEEKLIERFFSETDCIPPYLEEDQELFLSIEELRPDTDNPEIPDTLLERLSSIAEESDDKQSGKTQEIWKKVIAYAALGTCACLALAFGIKWHYYPDAPAPVSVGHSYVPSAESSASHQTRHSEHKDVSDPSDEKQKPMATETHLRKVINECIADKNDINDGYIEITDPKEAERITLEIGQLLASNSKKTDEAFSRLTYAIDEYKEITKSVLK